jgi:hypothetical protein
LHDAVRVGVRNDQVDMVVRLIERGAQSETPPARELLCKLGA